MSRLGDDATHLRKALYAAGRSERASAAAKRATIAALAAAEANAKAAPAGGGSAKATSIDLLRAGNGGWSLVWGLLGIAALAGLASGISEVTPTEGLPAPAVEARTAVNDAMPVTSTSPSELPAPAAPTEPSPAEPSAAVAMVAPTKHAPPAGASRLERRSAPTHGVAKPQQVHVPTTASRDSTDTTSEPLEPGAAPSPNAPAQDESLPAEHAIERGSDASLRHERNTALAEEVQRMQAIRRELRAGRTAEAMRLLDQYRTDYPTGVLADEALVLRVEALIHVGRNEEARLLARRFLAERPRSPYSARVSTLLSSAGEPRAHQR